MINNEWYNGAAIRDLIISRRHKAAKDMYDAIQNGDAGIGEAAIWQELDTIITAVDAKKPAAETTATGEE